MHCRLPHWEVVLWLISSRDKTTHQLHFCSEIHEFNKSLLPQLFWSNGVEILQPYSLQSCGSEKVFPKCFTNRTNRQIEQKYVYKQTYTRHYSKIRVSKVLNRMHENISEGENRDSSFGSSYYLSCQCCIRMYILGFHSLACCTIFVAFQQKKEAISTAAAAMFSARPDG